MRKVNHDQLWNFAQKIERRELDCYRSGALDPIGLLLHPTPLLNEYPSPYNGFQFGGTGGDAVSFSYLEQGDTDYGESPIIMSVPCADIREVIVGENLFDFLCLGSDLGFFFLEEYAYSPDKFLKHYGEPKAAWKEEEDYERQHNPTYPDDGHLSGKKEILRLLRDEFSLEPWRDLEKRIAKLQDDYLKFVKPCTDWDFGSRRNCR